VGIPRTRLRAVTVDAFGTLVEADGHIEALERLVSSWGLARSRGEIVGAFRTEVAFYRPRSLTGRDPASLRQLRLDATAIFLDALGAPVALRRADVMPAFVDALRFRVIDGALPALDRLTAAGLRLAVCANWDVGLHDHLERLGLAGRFDAILTSADVGAEKPNPCIFLAALERLGVAPEEAVHVGNEEADRLGALAAGLAFEPVPLATVPDRLGL